jgi:hypothetical protein
MASRCSGGRRRWARPAEVVTGPPMRGRGAVPVGGSRVPKRSERFADAAAEMPVPRAQCCELPGRCPLVALLRVGRRCRRPAAQREVH